MPTEAVHICAVRSMRYHNGTRFTVYAKRLGEKVWTDAFYTWDAWKASLCQESIKTSAVVVIGSRETRFGEEIVTVAPQQEATV